MTQLPDAQDTAVNLEGSSGHEVTPHDDARLDPTAVVTAVIVTRGESDFLRHTLRAVLAQTLRPGRLLVVNVSEHTTPVLELLAEPTLQCVDVRAEVFHAPRARTFGAAVSAGLAEANPAEAVPEQAKRQKPSTPDLPTEPDWLWLLHDDSAPEPEALAALVRSLEHTPSVAIAGVKQRDWFEPSRLLEVGLTTSPAGRRMTGIELGEVDQGQHDGREDVFAVGLAGALFRTDVWHELDGTDPEYGLFGDGLEVGQRARLAGYRVIVVPDAAIRHAQRSFNALTEVSPDSSEAADLEDAAADVLVGEDDQDADAVVRIPAQAAGPVYEQNRELSYGARRRSALLFRLVASSPLGVPFHMLAMVLLAPLRALWQLAAKRPRRARYELTAVAWAVLRPAALWRCRARARRTARVPRRALQPLRASWRDVWAERRDLRLARAELRRTVDTPDPLDRQDRRKEIGRRLAALGGVTAALAGVSFWWFGSLTGAVNAGGRIVSPSLLLAQDSGGELWRMIADGWSQSGFGSPVPVDPLVTVLTPIALLSPGGLQTVVHLVLLGSVLLGGLGAWFAAGCATSSLLLRAWAVFAWVALPMGTLALSDGRFGSVLAHLALPWVVFGALRGVGVRRPLLERVAPQTAGPLLGTGSIPAAAGAGLAFALVVGGAPVLFLPGVLVLMLVAVLVPRRRGQRSYRRNLFLVAIAPLVVLLPVAREVTRLGWADFWPVFLAAPGAPVASHVAPAWQQLLGWPSTAPTWWAADGFWGELLPAVPFALGGLVLLFAVVALVRQRDVVRAVRGAWLVGALGLASALAVGFVLVGRGVQYEVHAWSGPLLSLAFAGFLGAGLLGLDGAAQRAAQHSFGWRQTGIVLGVVVTLAVTGVSVTQMVRTHDLTAPDRAGLRILADPVVPVVGQQVQEVPRQARVLALEVGEHLTFEVLRVDGPQLADVSALTAVRDLVAQRKMTTQDTAAEDAPLQDPDELLARVAAQLVGGVDGGTSDLSELGIGAVLLTSAGTFEQRVAVGNRLDTIPGLERIAESVSGEIWRVAVAPDSAGLPQGLTSADPSFDVQPAWARLMLAADAAQVAADQEEAEEAGDAVTVVPEVGVLVPSNGQEIDTDVAAGGNTRVLVLAERADQGWRASVDGRRLRVAPDQWRQAFELGPDAGRLKVWYETSGATVWRAVLVTVLGLYVLLAIPVRRRVGVR